jgi:hypothetical protein
MVADALDGLGHEDQVDAGRDGARVFHHVGDQLAQQAFELLVDLVVLLEDFQRTHRVQPGKGVQRLAQLRDCQLRPEGQVTHGQA